MEEMTTRGGVRLTSFRSAALVPPGRWDEIAFGSMRGVSHQWATFFERSMVKEPRIEYVLIDDDRGPLGNIVVSELRPGDMPWLVQQGMKLSLSLVSPFSIGGGLAVRSTDDLTTDLRVLCGAVVDLARMRRKLSVTVMAVRDEFLPPLEAEGFIAIPGDATTELDVPDSYEGFLSGLRGRFRGEIRRLGRRAAEAGVTFSFSTDFGGRSEELFPLVSEVFGAHDSGENPLRPNVYSMASEVFGDDAVLFEASVKGQVAATMMVIREKEQLKIVLPGLNYELSRKHGLYLLLYDQIVRWAIDHEIKLAIAGNTTYELKEQAGYRKVRLRTCYRAVWPAANSILRTGTKVALGIKARRERAPQADRTSPPKT